MSKKFIKKPAAPVAKPAPAAQVAPAVEPVAVVAPLPVVEVAALAPSPELIESAQAVQAEIVAGAADIQSEIADSAQKAIGEARAAVVKAKDEAAAVSVAVESSVSVLTKGLAELNAKVLSAVRSNSEAALDLFKATFAAKSPSQLIALQSEHTRKQLELFSAQVKDFSAAANKIAEEAAKPIKAKLDKALAA